MRRRFPLLFWLMVAAAIALTLAWGSREIGPTRWDDSWYLAASVRLYDRFAEQGLAGLWRGFQGALEDKAPLITLLPLPFFWLIGRSVFVVYLVNSALCALLAVSLFRFCRRFFEERTALVAVLFTLTAPLMAGLSRLFLVEYGLTVLVVACCAALAEWEATRRYRHLAWFGVLCGLGLLMKVTFPLFVGPVAAVVLWRVDGRRARQLLADIVLVAAPAVLLAGNWYWHNWETVTHRSFQETYFVPTHAVERTSPVRMAGEYLLVILTQGLSPLHALAAGAGLAAWAARRRGNFLGPAVYYLVPWVAALPLFALSENRDTRLIAPAIPALAIAAAVLVDPLLRGRRRATGVLAAGLIAVTLAQSFALLPHQGLRLGPVTMLAYETDYSFAPNPHHWPLAETLERMAQRERLGPRSKLIVGLGADTWSFNSNNLDLEAALLRLPFEFHTTAYTSDRHRVRRIMSGVQYFLHKEGGTQQFRGRFEGGPMTVEFLTEGPLFREIDAGMAAPDGGRIRIFANDRAGPDVFSAARSPAPLPQLPPVELNFGNQLEITGLRASEKDGIFTVAARWRCRNRPEAPYRAFVHVVDAQNRLLGSLDHEILHGSPRVDEWEPGDEGYEARHLALPAAAARGATLRLGIYDPQTGTRPVAWTSTFPLKDDYTAAVMAPVTSPEQEPPTGRAFHMEPAPLEACVASFEGGVLLSGCSVRRAGDTVWLRLRWSAPRQLDSKLRFFGHAVASRDREARILLSFDQDLELDRRPRPRRPGRLEFIQDIVRDVSKLTPEAKWIRAGVFDVEQPLDRLAVEHSSLPASPEQKAIYLPLP